MLIPWPMKGKAGLNKNCSVSQSVQIHDTLSALPFPELFILKGGGLVVEVAYHFSLPVQPIHLPKIKCRSLKKGGRSCSLLESERKQPHLEANG